MNKDNTYLYETMPVSRAVYTLAVPTVISRLITEIYNMADTFFIGQMNDPNQVAAATIAMPVFVMMTGIALGGILNIVLDPIFIFGFDLKITGAAAATMLSNVCSTFFSQPLFIKSERKVL